MNCDSIVFNKQKIETKLFIKLSYRYKYKMLSYRRETALQGAL